MFRRISLPAPLISTCIVFIAFSFNILAAQASIHAYVGAKLYPISSDPIEQGVLLVKDGHILAVGTTDEITIPDDAVITDVSGKVIMPGLVCTHSHIGQVSGADASGPIQPEVRAYDSINVRDSRIEKARAGGITTANIMPGSGHLLSGQTIYLKLRDGNSVDDLVIRTVDGTIAGGIKMANGTNPRKGAPFPGTRAKSAALVREQYIKAQEYQKKLQAAADDPEKDPPERDLGLEALVEVLEGKRVVHHHTHRHDDILTVLRLKEEFGFRLVLQHVSEAWKVADEIAAADVPCSIIYLDSPGGKLEARDIDWRNGAELEKRGVVTGFHTDDGVTDSRWFLRSAGFAVRAGMSESGALYGMTMAGALMLDLDDRIGSLTSGKDADFIVLNGNPLSVYTRIEQTWVEGEKVFDLSDPQDRLWANGGYGAGTPRTLQLCCYQHLEN
ncbi:amidohydrolase family protein [Opitutia bacterium ISCC 51]|nr:amidohydrolase family protein [Opitutae bacterium ISCC 51]QXD30021.1 amidohydrolase family protein [Opitutae bacterium ISCC 52]